ncbi:sensor domain-containing protein [Nocardia higoensis]|uniref:sensor domain-containing protein n=1 Tax=Nocardia higoensis TaxID=228599 RepID=UPI00059305DB|nr:sensor domain-containing protein [Nocardia higoensis]
MRTTAYAAAVVTTLALLTGCGSSEGAGSEADQVDLGALGPIVPAAPVTDPVFTDADNLALRLLGEDDLPAGMVAAYDPADPSTRPASVPSPTTPAGCGKVLMALGYQRPEAIAWTGVAYDGPEFAGIDIDAASYAEAGPAFTAVQETLHNCAEYFGEDGEGARIDYRLGALDQPPAGDASTSFQLHMTSEGATLVAQATLVQVGSTLVQIAVTAPEASDPALLAELTAAQVRALRGE